MACRCQQASDQGQQLAADSAALTSKPANDECQLILRVSLIADCGPDELQTHAVPSDEHCQRITIELT